MAVITQTRSLRGSRIAVWVLLLALGQLADLLTTQAAMARGAIEANSVAAGLLAAGGLGLLWVVKGSLVVAMTAAVLLVRRCWAAPERRAAVAGALVWRGLQLCVAVLAITAMHNLSVIGLLPGV
ncbi:MAG TPA: hypothetical protein VIO84_09190 [Candidatus Dormibacteraeota bacterium]|jgi:hypothetical protein